MDRHLGQEVPQILSLALKDYRNLTAAAEVVLHTDEGFRSDLDASRLHQIRYRLGHFGFQRFDPHASAYDCAALAIRCDDEVLRHLRQIFWLEEVGQILGDGLGVFQTQIWQDGGELLDDGCLAHLRQKGPGLLGGELVGLGQAGDLFLGS